jgi:hypothetical protein
VDSLLGDSADRDPVSLRALVGISPGQRGLYVVRVSGLEGSGSTAPPFTREPTFTWRRSARAER